MIQWTPLIRTPLELVEQDIFFNGPTHSLSKRVRKTWGVRLSRVLLSGAHCTTTKTTYVLRTYKMPEGEEARKGEELTFLSREPGFQTRGREKKLLATKGGKKCFWNVAAVQNITTVYLYDICTVECQSCSFHTFANHRGAQSRPYIPARGPEFKPSSTTTRPPPSLLPSVQNYQNSHGHARVIWETHGADGRRQSVSPSINPSIDHRPR